jgi:hypothetical protein
MKFDSLEDSLGRLEEDCGLPHGFALALLEEDDWSFIIKLHALMESAVSQLLANALARPELADVFAALEMSNTKTGKIAFVRALDLLPKQHTDFIRALSELRNQLVHRVKNITFDLSQHFTAERDKRSSGDARKLADKWGFSCRDASERPQALTRFDVTWSNRETGEPVSRAVIFFARPKGVILTSALAILDAISMANRYGKHMWTFLMESDDQATFITKAEQVFAKAKVGDPEYPFKVRERLERRNPHLHIQLDSDKQPILESLAAAFYLEYKRILTEL